MITAPLFFVPFSTSLPLSFLISWGSMEWQVYVYHFRLGSFAFTLYFCMDWVMVLVGLR